ncbi:hypothetical protein GTP45_15610 [Pseudoduganella sp. FT55W]|uniref:Uncharacterized protein n=1 Tax=Duganella rivi TaxID=2666083 RepID=A0A7X4GRC1_9BURK|nr:hypothetical protein [Duganella rivi]MYM68247.1 hypothetical protein [Duganella rivi]
MSQDSRVHWLCQYVSRKKIMPSFVWGRSPKEAWDNPYEYAAQDQFMREATSVLDALSADLDRYTMKFHRDDTGVDKATWMLSLDLVDSLRGSIELFREKRHRIAFRLFRDVVETIDLIGVLHAGNVFAERTLRQWYKNNTISHGEIRKYMESTQGKAAAENRQKFHHQLSKLTHRTYRALTMSFSLGPGDMMVPDTHSSPMLILPQTIAEGLAVLSNLIIEAIECLKLYGPLERDQVSSIFLKALEVDSVPRRFAIHGGHAS